VGSALLSADEDVGVCAPGEARVWRSSGARFAPRSSARPDWAVTLARPWAGQRRAGVGGELFADDTEQKLVAFTPSAADRTLIGALLDELS
jgi:hypothetical protein